MKRRVRATAPLGVAWRDGVHVLGTSIWCDARRARAVCFVSAADRTGRAGHGQLIATAETLALLGAARDAHLAAPMHRPFTLGTTRLVLVPSGYAPGAAAIAVDTGTHRVLYAGAIHPARADLAPCDTLVVAAPYGERHHAFPADAESRAIAVCVEAAAAGALPVVLVSGALRGLAIAERLIAAGFEVAAHRAIAVAARRLEEAGLPAPAIRRGVARAGVLLWLVRDHARVAATTGTRAVRTILASGLATERDAVRTIGADVAIPWSGAADREGLLAFVERSTAGAIAVTGPCAAAIAAAIGPRARALGPPQQMALFAS